MPESNPESQQSQVAAGFDAVYRALPQSQTWRRIGREVYGADYPEEAEPFSTITLTDLHRIARELAVGPGQVFADIACGHGGPGLWVARESGAALVGIDISPVAIAQATERAQAFGLSERARFLVGTAEKTGVDAASVAGVISIDAFWLFPDKSAAAAEAARMLTPGGRFVFTTWECSITPPGWQPQVADHHDLLQDAGFVVEVYEEMPDWEQRQRAFTATILAARAELIAEMGPIAEHLVTDPAYISFRKRVLIAARKRPYKQQ